MTRADQKNVFSDYKVLSAGAFKRYRSPKVAIKWNRTYLMGKTVLLRREKEHSAESTVEVFVYREQQSLDKTTGTTEKGHQFLSRKFILLSFRSL